MHRRSFLLGAGAAAVIPGAACGQARVGTFRPEDFGAKGDGRTDDTAAFAALSAALARAGGGTVALRPVTYRVGAQRAATDGEWAYRPEPVIQALNLAGPFRLEGNGARLVARTGLKYGTFERRTGRAVRRAMPNMRRGEWASPYRAMVHVAGVRGPVEITGLELDGALPDQVIGGPWGDLGHQIPAFGLLIENNGSGELIADVRSRRHGQDGMLIAARTDRRARTRLERVVCEENGRQGASLVAGRGFDLVDCDFRRTGRGPIASAPGAGVDIEAERDQPVRDLTFTRCRFEDNHGVGMVADSGDTEGALFSECRFVGTTNPSAWPSKPRFRFERCTFVGGLLRAHGDLQRPELATRFTECRFVDDPRMSPTGKVYGPLSADLGETANPLFERCRFELTHANLLPWSVNGVYRDCEMSQRAGGQAYPRGRYQGRNVIRGNVELAASRIEGEVVLNGRRLPRS